jgi:hypothetical protein
LLRKDASISVSFPSVIVAKIILWLRILNCESMTLSSHATNIYIFENPFFVEVSYAPEKLQLVLSELQYDKFPL